MYGKVHEAKPPCSKTRAKVGATRVAERRSRSRTGSAAKRVYPKYADRTTTRGIVRASDTAM